MKGRNKESELEKKELCFFKFDSEMTCTAFYSKKQIREFRKTLRGDIADAQKARIIYRLGIECLMPKFELSKKNH